MPHAVLNQHPWPTRKRQGWLPQDIAIEQLKHRFGPAEITAIKQLTANIRAAGTSLFDVKPQQFRDPVLDRFILPLVDELKNGPGVVLLSGFEELGDPADADILDDWRFAYWGIGSYFGDQVSQSARGDLMGDVRVRPEKSPRAYTSPDTLRLHSDRIDMLTLLCVHNAKTGGANGFASSLAIHDIVKRERPDILEILRRGFRQSRNGEEQPGQEPITPYRVGIRGKGQRLQLPVERQLFHRASAQCGQGRVIRSRNRSA